MTLKQLEALAQAATPGPWDAVVRTDPRGQPVPYYRALVGLLESGTESVSVVQKDGREVDPGIEQQEQNAAYIAAHDPARMLRIYAAIHDILETWPRHVQDCVCAGCEARELFQGGDL